MGKKHEIVSIPNILTLIRIVLIPVCVVLYLSAEDYGGYILAGVVLAVSCITDMFDGLIARKCNMITTLGQILDPIADKGTQFAMIVCLAIKWPVIWYIVPLFVVKEGFQFVVGAVHYKRGQMLKGALMPGKICTTVMFISMITMIVFPGIPPWGITLITVVCAVFLVISFVCYILAYFGKNKKIRDL